MTNSSIKVPTATLLTAVFILHLRGQCCQDDSNSQFLQVLCFDAVGTITTPDNMRRAGKVHGIWHQYAYYTIVADIAEKRAEESCWIPVGVYIPASKERERKKEVTQ